MTQEQAQKILCKYLDLDKEEHSEFLDAIRTLIQPQADGDLMLDITEAINDGNLKAYTEDGTIYLDDGNNRLAVPSAKPSRDMEEIEEIINCDADAETKCKMISNILTAKPHYFEEQEPKTGHYLLKVEVEPQERSEK